MNESETVGQRFVQLISHLGITKNAFATSIGKTATVIQHLVEERNKPGFDLLGSVFRVYPNVSRDWLMLGNGPMLLADNSLSATPAPAIASPAKAKISAPILEVPEAAPKNVWIESVPEPKSEAALTNSPEIPEAPIKAASPIAPASVSPSSEAAPVAAAPTASAPLPAPPAPAAASVSAEAAWQPALYTQQMAHQLAMAELRNQHLQEQQRLMQQMLDLMQRQLSPR